MTDLAIHRTAAPAGGLAGCVLAACGQPAWAAVAVLAGVAVGVVPADLRERRIPTGLVAAGAVGGVAVAFATALQAQTLRPVLLGAMGAAVVGGAFLAVHLAHPAGLGFGDVRLAALAGWLVAYGAGSLTAAVATAVVAAVVSALTTVATRSRSAPFAPYLIGTSLLVVAVAALR